MLSEESKSRIQEFRIEYPDPGSALLPALYLAQKDYGGWLPDQAYDELASVMDLAPAYVAATASFYTMFNRRPVGQHVIQVCTNVSCSLLGAEHLLDYLSLKLGIGPGETTADGKFTLLEVECLGSCGTAPMMQLGSRYYENLTEDRLDEILASLD